MTALPELHVIGASDVLAAVEGHREECLDAVRNAYVSHDLGATVNPHSSFLRFPDRPGDRIIALPAYLQDEEPVSGIKWISSFPHNTDAGVPRASAVLVLNNHETGYPAVLLEASVLSATRTAASAALGAETLLGNRRASRVAVVGTGLIARHIVSFLIGLGWEVGSYHPFDLCAERADAFTKWIYEHGEVAESATTLEEAVCTSDLVILATVASEPHLTDPALLAHNPVVLHVSLRDIGPEIVLSAYNVTDDIDHAVREHTSLHLAEQQVGNHDFIHTTIGGLLRDPSPRPEDKPAIFAPFGLGILDLAIGRFATNQARINDAGIHIADFFQGVDA